MDSDHIVTVPWPPDDGQMARLIEAYVKQHDSWQGNGRPMFDGCKTSKDRLRVATLALCRTIGKHRTRTAARRGWLFDLSRDG